MLTNVVKSVSDKKNINPVEPYQNPSAHLLDPFDKPVGRIVRFTMSHNLQQLQQDVPLPFGYRLETWYEPMLPAYAATLAVAFSDSPDLDFYPKLSSKEGCSSLIKEIAAMKGFLTGVSWLAFFNREPCALILSDMLDNGKTAIIRVIGVAPRHRRIHIGSQLASKVMWALKDRKFQKVLVRVSRSNRPGIMFFRALGFHVDTSKEYL